MCVSPSFSLLYFATLSMSNLCAWRSYVYQCNSLYCSTSLSLCLFLAYAFALSAIYDCETNIAPHVQI